MTPNTEQKYRLQTSSSVDIALHQNQLRLAGFSHLMSAYIFRKFRFVLHFRCREPRGDIHITLSLGYIKQGNANRLIKPQLYVTRRVIFCN